ncbi:MAG: methyltransferase domain-containing protein [Acidobacteria bacterium]|nr:methyltransferase domain-containing protein [Acidobacteriota bacterium]
MSEPTPKYDVYISAANKDGDFALKLMAILEARKYSVFFNPDGDVEPGADSTEMVEQWSNGLQQNLSLSRYMLALLGYKAFSSRRVRLEVDIRKILDSRQGESTILPVYLDQQAEKDWKPCLGHVLTAKTCLDGDVETVAWGVMEMLGTPIIQRGQESIMHAKLTLSSVLESVAKPHLEPMFDSLRLSLAMDLKRLVAEMENEGTCKLSMSIYYDVSVDILKQVRDGGNVQVTNILWHQEWKDMEFARDYLEEEARLIRERGLRVERFFIGTPSLFDSPDIRRLIHRNRVAGVIVRCLYVTEDMKSDQPGNIFDWDIGIYETAPKCFVQGHHRSGYLVYGTIGTTELLYKRLHKAFEHYEQLACPSRERNLDEDRALQLSRIGWRLPYFDDSQPAWQSDPCPMVKEKVEFLIQRAVKRGYEAADRSGQKIVLVDAGCGDGRNLQYLAELCCALVADDKGGLEFELVGVDLCDSAVRQARERLRRMELPPCISWRVHERNIVYEVPVVSRGVDIFICTDTFTNIYSSEVPRALREWRRALRVGGMLLLNAYTPDDDTQKHCEREARNNSLDSQKDHHYENAWWYKKTFYQYYEKQELLMLMNEANFAVVTLEHQQWQDPPHPGYREEEHIHMNWVAVAERPG